MSKPEEEEPTHWIPYDEPEVWRGLKRAICGTLTRQHALMPTCRACVEYLHRADAETVEDRFGK